MEDAGAGAPVYVGNPFCGKFLAIELSLETWGPGAGTGTMLIPESPAYKQ